MRALRHDVTTWGRRCTSTEEARPGSKGDGRNQEREGMIELHAVNSGERVAMNPQFITEIKEEVGGATIWLTDAGIGRLVTESYDEVMKMIHGSEPRPLPFDFEGK